MNKPGFSIFAVITIDNPPVNALSWHVRQGLVDGMHQAVADGAAAVVLICAGRTFIAGADISEFGGAPRGPSLPEAQEGADRHGEGGQEKRQRRPLVVPDRTTRSRRRRRRHPAR